jgi:hypothetical protein
VKFLSEPSPRPWPTPVPRWVLLLAAGLAGFVVAFRLARGG